MNQDRRPPRLFQLYPAATDLTLIMRWGNAHDQALDDQFADAADRLASTFAGQPIDDHILLPWLYLYRHAMELTMKRSIFFAARLRQNNRDPDPDLESDRVAARLKAQLGHRLSPLLEELERHLSALRLPPVDANARRIVSLVGELDPRGEALRYEDQLPETTDRIDFVRLSEAVATAYGTLASTLDMLDAYGEGQADYLDERAQIEAEIEAEFRDDWY